jgi:flagellar hook-associated protein 2
MSFSIDGLVSGLDTTSIIDGLVSLQASQVDRLNGRKNEIITQQTAFKGIEARLLNFRSSLSKLNRSSGSVFDGNIGTSSNEDVLTVNAGDNAAEGTYSVRVTSLAKAQQLGSQGISGSAATISQGTISFQVGAREATEITIDSSNNSVEGLVDAINSQSDDVSASIVRDQANNTNRILLTSRYTGEANEINITNNLAATSGSEVRPDFSGLAVQEAANATVQLGSGPGAIVAEYDSNTVEGLIEDVTLNLSSVDVDNDVTINVRADDEEPPFAIQEFFESYNELVDFIDQQTAFDSVTGEASPLIGNRSVNDLKNRLGALVTDVVPGLDGSLNRLSQIGLEIDNGGKLTFDSNQLDKVLNGEVEGVDRSDLKRLFGLGGTSDSSGIEFILGSARTNVSAGAIEVDISQAAEQGSVTATSIAGTTIADALNGTVTIDDASNELTFTVDGQATETLTLTNGTYTYQEIADELQSVLGGSSLSAAQNVSVSIDGGKLSLTSASYGSNSTLAAFAGSAAAALGFTGSESGRGIDVVGNFIVDGVVEPATGTGRVLIGDSENENTADLQLKITLGASDVTGGTEGSITLSRGITSRMDQYFADLLDTESGTLKTASEDFELRIESLDASIERVNAISEAKTQFLIEQFAALERVLGELQGTSSFLSAQLASL